MNLEEDPQRAVQLCCEAQARLMRTVLKLTDQDLQATSLLPGRSVQLSWSIWHVMPMRSPAGFPLPLTGTTVHPGHRRTNNVKQLPGRPMRSSLTSASVCPGLRKSSPSHRQPGGPKTAVQVKTAGPWPGLRRTACTKWRHTTPI
ncbi:hypothetical protein OL239_11645 [Arthrobacter sp. ATA002]|nr:hypothetical protein [Arthrobacter sp. ATA002]WAP50679.1 hypothetical protein OL239_11645 [Arthrobacter sp. ATA002]